MFVGPSTGVRIIKKLVLPVSLSVSKSVRKLLFLKNSSKDFYDFCMKLGDNAINHVRPYMYKLTEPDFSGKFLKCLFLA